MKITFLPIAAFFFVIISSCSNQEANPNEQAPKLIIDDEKKFELNYIYSGLGSGMGSKGPRFKINGNKFLKTEQQNSSWTGEYDEKVDTICEGQINLSSIDSIKAIANKIKQSKIYETNPNVMSGGVHNITITFKKKKLEFVLYNASHPKAKEIIKIVNSNIPLKCGKLFLWKGLDERDGNKNEWKFPDDVKN